MMTKIVINQGPVHPGDLFWRGNQLRPQSPIITAPLDADRLERLAAYALLFRDVVPRADQRERLELYLRGVLDGVQPKNAEAIAGRWAGDSGVSGTAQALQHFLGSSPWEFGRFLACYRSQLPEARGGQLRLWAVQDVVIPKKGQHSVGTQRQFARPLGRKINCQVAVAVSELRPDGFFPLAIRLYLPGFWLREYRDLADRLVPAEHREHLSKSDIAIQLIDELRGGGRTVDWLTADGGFLSSQGFREAVTLREMRVVRPGEDASTLSDGIPSPGGLLSGNRAGWGPAPDGEREAAALAQACLAEANRGFDWLKRHLGLDQYEGRNWLGWHHHAALIFAAYGFLVSENRDAAGPSFCPAGCEEVAT
jgi:SRSO17 transposase